MTVNAPGIKERMAVPLKMSGRGGNYVRLTPWIRVSLEKLIVSCLMKVL